MTERKQFNFPNEMPAISIQACSAPSIAVDCCELRWWFAEPKLGTDVAYAMYEAASPAPLISVKRLQAIGMAEIHGVEAVELLVTEENRANPTEQIQWHMYARLNPHSVEWLATVVSSGGKKIFYTFRDSTFVVDWGEIARKLVDDGRFQREADGYAMQDRGAKSASGAGMYTVQIGEQRYTCLRVLDIDDQPTAYDTLVEAFIDPAGRTVLCRRYNGRLYPHQRGQAWDEVYPHNQRMKINGVTFVHWYDCLPSFVFADVAANSQS
jgi:hypothetical protein